MNQASNRKRRRRLIPLILLVAGLAVGGGVWIAVGGPGEPPEKVKVKPVIPVALPEPAPQEPGPVEAETLAPQEMAAKPVGGGTARQDGNCTLLAVCPKPATEMAGMFNTRIYTDGTYLYHDFIQPGETVAYQPTAQGGWVVTAPPGDGIVVAVIPVDVTANGTVEFVPGWGSPWWEHNVKSLQIVAVAPPVCRDRARIGRDGEVVPVTFIEAIYQSRPAAKPTSSGQSVELI
jgi:hypothetical protein